MAAWTAPKTWSSEPLTVTDLNTHLRDNLEALKDPPSAAYMLDESSNYTTTSTAFTDVDATNLALTITPAGSEVMVHFHGTIMCTTGTAFLDVDVDGSRVAGDDGIVRGNGVANEAEVCSFTIIVSGLTAGASHTFKLQWKASAGTATLYAGAGTTNLDLHPQFWVREVS